MRLTIFSRLVTGYFLIFILAMSVSVYTITQLRQLEEVTRSILNIDNRLADLEQKLTGVLLSMIEYEKKFVIIKDEKLYDNFLLAKDDFDKYLNELTSLANTAQLKSFIMEIIQHHQRYQFLFDEEVRYLKSAQNYPGSWYKQEKENTVNGIMNVLKKLRAYNQQNVYDKVIGLGEAEVNASKVAIVMGLGSLIIGVFISIFITISITKPLSALEEKTREITRGDFGTELNLSSPPEMRALAQAFNSMYVKLKEVDRMKSDFFSLMSHELRTPLTSIKEGTNLLIENLKGKVTEKQKRLFTIIVEESNRLINLINSLLDLSKMDAGMMKYSFTQANIAPLITMVIREIEPLADTKNIKLETEISKELPHVKMDIERILQVLRNLIGNAVKFSRNYGYVRVFARQIDQGIKISIVDRGTGIPEENLTKIFDKFQQTTLVSPGKIRGTGLGLYIVNRIIHIHGGKVWVESTSEQGSIFTFVLPA